MDMKDMPKFVKRQLDDINDEQLDELMGLLNDYAEKRKKEQEEKPDLTKIFSRDCGMKVHITGDEKNETSCVEVEFNGCNGIHDLMLVGVAAIAGILDNVPDEVNKAKFLAEIGTIAIAGKGCGIYNTKEELLAAEKKRKGEE